MTSVNFQTVGSHSWPDIHHSGHVMLCGSWSSWPTFGQRAASAFEPGPQRLGFGTYVNMTYVNAQTVGSRSWPEISSLRAPYAVWFVVIVLLLMVLNIAYTDCVHAQGGYECKIMLLATSRSYYYVVSPSPSVGHYTTRTRYTELGTAV